MRTRILPILMTTLLLAFFLPNPARAAGDGIFQGEEIPAGTSIDHDVLLFGQNVRIDGTVNGNAFILGNQVIVNGTVDGSLVLIAQNASVGGMVSGAVYALALTIDLPSPASLDRDLYSASVSLTSGKDSLIARHLYALGLDAGLNGQVGGDLHTVLGPIQLYNGLMRLLGFEELTLELHIEVPPASPAPQGSLPLRHLRLKLLEPLPAFDWGEWGLSLLRHWGVLLIFGLLAWWLTRRQLACSGKPLAANPLKTLAVGLVVLVVAFNLFIVGLIVFILVFALGMGINWLGLWQVTVALWVVGFSAWLVGMVGLALFIAIGTKVIVAWVAGTWLFGRLFQRKAAWLDLLALIAGISVYVLLRTIPYAGWGFDLLVTAAGIGSAWLALRGLSNRKTIQASTQPVPAVCPVEVVPPVTAVAPVKPVKARPAKK